MKKFVIVLLFVYLTLVVAQPQKVCYATEQEYYAKIQTGGAYFYSSQDELTSMFELPYSYFVKTKYATDKYFSATYKNLNGYVKKEDVVRMNGTPQQPFASATFKAFVSNYLYASPTQTSTTIIDISTSDILAYYGRKSGEQLNSQTNTWFFCSVEKNGQLYYGYIFSGITDYLTNIPENTETFEVVKDSDSGEQNKQIATLSTKTKIMLIIAITIPSVLILYFLIKPSRVLASKAIKNQKREKKKVHHGDYFEFDENEL